MAATSPRQPLRPLRAVVTNSILAETGLTRARRTIESSASYAVALTSLYQRDMWLKREALIMQCCCISAKLSFRSRLIHDDVASCSLQQATE